MSPNDTVDSLLNHHEFLEIIICIANVFFETNRSLSYSNHPILREKILKAMFRD